MHEKSNKIKAIAELLDNLNVKWIIIIINAIRTFNDIAQKIKNKKTDYVLTVRDPLIVKSYHQLPKDIGQMRSV